MAAFILVGKIMANLFHKLDRRKSVHGALQLELKVGTVNPAKEEAVLSVGLASRRRLVCHDNASAHRRNNRFHSALVKPAKHHDPDQRPAMGAAWRLRYSSKAITPSSSARPCFVSE